MQSKELTKEAKVELSRRIKRSSEFQRTFSGKDGESVRAELKKNFTGGFNKDPYVHAYLAGQNAVIQFIDNCINSDVEKAKELLERKEDE